MVFPFSRQLLAGLTLREVAVGPMFADPFSPEWSNSSFSRGGPKMHSPSSCALLIGPPGRRFCLEWTLGNLFPSAIVIYETYRTFVILPCNKTADAGQ